MKAIAQRTFRVLALFAAVVAGFTLASLDEIERLTKQTETTPGVTTNDLNQVKHEIALLREDHLTESFDFLDDDMVRRLDRVEARLNELKIHQEDLTEAIVVMEDLDVASYEETMSPEERAVREDAYALEQVNHIEATAMAEPVDPDWALSAQDKLQHAFAQEALQDYQLKSLDCRTTLCRLEVDVDSGEGGPEIFRALQENTPWDGAGFVEITLDPPQAVLFLAREGAEIPEIEARL